MRRRALLIFVNILLLVGSLVFVGETSLAHTEAHLAQDVSESEPPNGGSLALDSVEGFGPSGTVEIAPGTESAERVTYSGVDLENNLLLGLERSAPSAHPIGAPVAGVAEATASPSPTPEPSPTRAIPTTEPSATTSGADSAGVKDTSGQESTGSANSAPCHELFDKSCEEQVEDILDMLVGDLPVSCQDLFNKPCLKAVTDTLQPPPEQDCYAMAIQDGYDYSYPLPELSGWAALRCDLHEDVMYVVGCLLYNGVPVDCNVGTGGYTQYVETHVSAKCLPGLWTMVAFGDSTTGEPEWAATSGLIIDKECNPR